MNAAFYEKLTEKKRKIDRALPPKIEQLNAPESLKKAMLYSVIAGGKRVRPVLTLLTIESFGREDEIGIETACAIEMIHTYSLIHDDLPSMDDDDYRRGKLTNHKVFGEALAILSGDGLLTFSFEVLAATQHPAVSSDTKLRLIRKMAQAAGPEGMVGGQVDDLDGEGKELTLQQLENIHHHKTGDLLSFSIYSGALLAGATDDQLAHLERFAKHLGLAFQIQDDILDIEGDEKKIGKPVGSDLHNDKSTYPQLLTISGAKAKLQEELIRAKRYLKAAEIEDEMLASFLDYIVSRDH
jgi:geranylgeranyl diphosphate synthase type II